VRSRAPAAAEAAEEMVLAVWQGGSNTVDAGLVVDVVAALYAASAAAAVAVSRC